MKKTMILALAMMGCVLTAIAQDVTVLHMKDGTTRRFTNGVKNATQVQFFEYLPHEGKSPVYNTTQHDNGYSCQWDVTQAWHIDGQYSVAVVWEDILPEGFQPRYGLCLGTQPGLSVEHCDTMKYSVSEDSYWYDENYSRLHFVFVGQLFPPDFTLEWQGKEGEDGQRFDIIAKRLRKDNHLAISLQPGQTYYYRTFAEGQVEEGEQLKTKLFYGPEKSFRVPRVMADAGYFPTPCATGEAVAAFATHFPETVKAPAWKEMEGLWNLWLATDEGQQTDLSADITSDTFDDGTGYRLNRIPDAFYTWMSRREVIIDAFDGLTEISQMKNQYGEFEPTVMAEEVTDVDSIPGGKYMRFTPLVASVNHYAIYRSTEVVPGIRYRLVVNFAPETLPTATAYDLLPTRVEVWALHPDGSEEAALVKTHDVTALQMSAYENGDFLTTDMGLGLKIATHVQTSEVRNGLLNRTMRIAEIRLTPE